MRDDYSKNFDNIIQKNSIDARESTKKRMLHNFINNLMAGIAAYSFFPKEPML